MWIDTMPAIPLARGVPVLWDGVRAVCTHGFGNGSAEIEVRHPNGTRTQHVVVPRQVSVDLADPQGFGYALRWLRYRKGTEYFSNIGGPWLVESWLSGKTTDTDRLALAQAIAEVVGTNGEE